MSKQAKRADSAWDQQANQEQEVPDPKEAIWANKDIGLDHKEDPDRGQLREM